MFCILHLACVFVVRTNYVFIQNDPSFSLLKPFMIPSKFVAVIDSEIMPSPPSISVALSSNLGQLGNTSEIRMYTHNITTNMFAIHVNYVNKSWHFIPLHFNDTCITPYLEWCIMSPTKHCTCWGRLKNETQIMRSDYFFRLSVISVDSKASLSPSILTRHLLKHVRTLLT